MSMDEQYEQMRRFAQALDKFNEQLSATARELQAKHDYVSPFWQDEMRRAYDAEWLPLSERMNLYNAVEGRQYMEFLTVKIRLLERYLRGG